MPQNCFRKSSHRERSNNRSGECPIYPFLFSLFSCLLPGWPKRKGEEPRKRITAQRERENPERK